MPWVVLSQPITALAFTLDGVLYGAPPARSRRVGCARPSLVFENSWLLCCQPGRLVCLELLAS